MRKIIGLLIILCAVLLSACSTKVPVQNKPVITQEILLEKCTQDTPVPENFVLDKDGKKVYNGKEVLQVLIAWDKIYGKCSSTHNELVDTIRKLSDTKEIEIK